MFVCGAAVGWERGEVMMVAEVIFITDAVLKMNCGGGLIYLFTYLFFRFIFPSVA